MTSTRCPTCSKPLSIRDDAPPVLTCPNCLGRIIHPRTTAAPLPVVPLPDRDITADTSAASRWLIFLLVLAACGAVGLFSTGRASAGSTLFAIVMLFGTGACFVALLAPSRTNAPADHDRSPPRDPALSEDTRVLQYEPRERRQANLGRLAMKTVSAGFMFCFGIVLGVLAGFFLAITGMFILIPAIPAVGLVLVFVPGAHAVGAGMLFSVGVMFLILVSICGGFK